jgi:hypothetical protein
MTAEEFDALLEVSNVSKRAEIERLRTEAASQEGRNKQINERIKMLRKVLDRRKRLERRLEQVLAEVRQEERDIEGEIERALSYK